VVVVGVGLGVVGVGDGVVGVGEGLGDGEGLGVPLGDGDGLAVELETATQSVSQFFALLDSPAVPAAMRALHHALRSSPDSPAGTVMSTGAADSGVGAEPPLATRMESVTTAATSASTRAV
jgi:hypothetical protein